MLKLDTLKKKIEKAGFMVENHRFSDGNGGSYAGLIVRHDYNGLYPTDEARRAHNTAAGIARRAGYQAEARGCCTATLIF